MMKLKLPKHLTMPGGDVTEMGQAFLTKRNYSGKKWSRRESNEELDAEFLKRVRKLARATLRMSRLLSQNSEVANGHQPLLIAPCPQSQPPQASASLADAA